MNKLSLNALANHFHETAKSKGFYDEIKPASVYHMLMVTELAEATESARKGEPEYYLSSSGKPEGEAVEIIDCLIRILDYCGYKQWDVETIINAKHLYNVSRPHKHGKKF